MSTEFISVWKAVTPELAEELIAFWQKNKAIENAAIAKQRTQQAVCIVRDEKGALCGVSTAMVKVIPRLRQPLYYYRQFFAKALRGKHQELAFFQHSKQVLQDGCKKMKKPESLGILMEIENSKIAAAYKQAIIPGFEAVFIGYSPRGLPLRVSYFSDALLQAPVRSAPAAAKGVQITRKGSQSPIPGTKTASGLITTENAP